MSSRGWAGAVAIVSALTVTATAQSPGKPTTGNPTPGVAQPDPPNLADRVTLTGCVGIAANSATPDGNTVTDSRFVLTNAERQNKVPPDTGGSAAATAASSRTYRLSAIEAQLSSFVGTKVEVSGEITTRAVASSGSNANPILQVEFVQKLGTSCP